jgi:tetratricopeptide (TPR) repeat protein
LQRWHANPKTEAPIKTSVVAVTIANPAGGPLNGLEMPPVALRPDQHWQADLTAGKKAAYERRFEDAERLLREALKNAEGIFPSANPIAVTNQELANIYIVQQKFPKAEDLLTKAIASLHARPGAQPLDAVMLTNTLGTLYLMEGKGHDAEVLYAKNLTDIEANVGPRELQLGMALDRLAEAYSFQRMFEKAEPLLQRYMKISEEYYGPENQAMAVPLDHLGALYVNWHKYEKAEPLYRRGLAIHEKQFGINSPMLNGNLYSLADIMRNLGRPAEAQVFEARRQALSTSKKN